MTENTIDLTGDKTARALIDTIKGAVNGGSKYAAYVEAHKVTRETVKDHALALAVLTYPHEKPVQTVTDADGNKRRTKFGNAVQAAGNGLRAALPETEQAPKPVTLRATLSGEGGGSTVIPADHPLYAVIVAMIVGSEAAETDAA
jgi:hypothetical protein